MRMDEGLDTGPCSAQREEPIRADDDAGSLGARLADVGAAPLVGVLRRAPRGRLPAQRAGRRGGHVGAAPRARRTARSIGPSRADRVVRRVRALAPGPGRGHHVPRRAPEGPVAPRRRSRRQLATPARPGPIVTEGDAACVVAARRRRRRAAARWRRPGRRADGRRRDWARGAPVRAGRAARDRRSGLERPATRAVGRARGDPAGDRRRRVLEPGPAGGARPLRPRPAATGRSPPTSPTARSGASAGSTRRSTPRASRPVERMSPGARHVAAPRRLPAAVRRRAAARRGGGDRRARRPAGARIRRTRCCAGSRRSAGAPERRSDDDAVCVRTGLAPWAVARAAARSWARRGRARRRGPRRTRAPLSLRANPCAPRRRGARGRACARRGASRCRPRSTRTASCSTAAIPTDAPRLRGRVVRGAGPGVGVRGARARPAAGGARRSTPAPRPAGRRPRSPALVGAGGLGRRGRPPARARAALVRAAGRAARALRGRAGAGRHGARRSRGGVRPRPRRRPVLRASGSARRRPELLWRVPKDDSRALARLQVAITAASADLLRPGGRLVYSVCTFPRAETDAACDAHRAPPPRPRAGRRSTGPDGPASRGIRLWPHRHGSDGMFVAAFRQASLGEACS